MADTWEVISGYSATDYVDTMTFEVDAETKKLAKLSGQTLVAGEKNSQYIQIRMPRYWDGIDISEMNIGIIYDLNNSEYFGTTQAISAERTTDSIRFGWVVPEEACAVKGTLLFVIIVKGTDYVLKTQIADTPVVKSLNESGDIPEPTKETWYRDFQVRVEQTLSAAENAVEEAQSVLEQARSFVGSPLVAETAAGMVDTDRIYVYTGSEAGYTSGNWYYYNTGTSAWTSGGVYNAVAVDTDTTLTIAGKPADSKKTGDEISQIKEDFTYKVTSTTIFCDDLEDGWYSNNNGQKYPNTESSAFKRSKNLIPVEEGALYVGDRTTRCTCFDKNGTFLTYITVYASTEKFARQTIPTGTTHVGLTATNAPSFTLTKVDASGVTGIEYPYTSKGCVHVESCWCNGNGGVYSTANFDMLVIPVEEGERWYVNNQADSNLLCLDGTGTKITATYEARSPLGKIVTVPTGAKLMYVNVYRANTKGVNSEMADYVARLNGKKILAIGDSLTWLDGRSNNYGSMPRFSGWQRQLRLAGYDVISAGYSGNPYATGLDVVDGVDYSIYKEIVTKAYDVSGYDMIILFGGTNDVLYNGALGDRPTDYSNRTFDASKFNGALGAIISYIRTNNTTARILLASFPKSEAASRVYPNAKSRVEEIEYNADFWSCKYVNVWADLNVQPTYDGFDQFFYDATHANFLGMERIGQIMLNAVKAYE